jgi:sugar-specific transcriptional regulator TrmB
MEPTNILRQFGLTPNESAIYLAALELGEATARAIAERAQLPRTYVYDLLRTLAERGLISYLERGPHKRLYAAVQPKRLEAILAGKLEQFRKALPELETLYQQAPQRPLVRFFEGKDGIARIHDEIVAEAKELRFFGATTDWIRSFPDWYEFTKTFVDRKITIYDLVADLPETRQYAALYEGRSSQLRFTQPDWQFASDFVIWNNKVALHSYLADQMFAVVIESPAITQSMRTIFAILWQLGTPYRPQKTSHPRHP